MRIKIKSIIIIILFLNLLFLNLDFDLSAKNSSNEMNNSLTSISNNHLRDENYYWGTIEIISEPIFNKDYNNLMSYLPKIAIENDNIYVVWCDINDTNGAGTDQDIFFRYFNGTSWSSVEVISEPIPGMNINTGDSIYPSFAVEDGNIYVTWADSNNTNGAGTDADIFYRYFNGTSWSNVEVISEPIQNENINTLTSWQQSLAFENGNVYIVWQDQNNTNGSGYDTDIFYRYFNGTSWSNIEVISEPVAGKNINIGSSRYPSIAVENGNIYTLWEDFNNTNGSGTDGDIFYRHFNGNLWSNVEVISEPIPGANTNTGDGQWVSNKITVKNGNIYAVWVDTNNTNGAGWDGDIHYRCNRGSGWEEIQVISEPISGLNTNINGSFWPSIAVDNKKVYVVWSDDSDINNADIDYDIFYRYFNGSSWSNIEIISEPIMGTNINTGDSCFPDIAVENDTVCTVWYDPTNINGAGTDDDIFFRQRYSRPILSSGGVKPFSGFTYTYFNYTVNYLDKNNKSAVYVNISIDGINYSMNEVNLQDHDFTDGKDYFYNTTLNISINHTFQFFASPDGYFILSTPLIDAPDVFNSPPIITTTDNTTAFEDTYYEIIYEYEDVDIANVGQIGNWSFSSNASWLVFNSTTAMLNGIPINDDVGEYWVNISVNDTMAIDFTNFTLSVLEVNDNPIITTTDIEFTYEDAVYYNDYNATDIDSPIENQIWSLETNASLWLSIYSDSGVISGTPTNDEVGSYWVNVSVDDGEKGSNFTNFTLIVLNVNDPPEIITEDITTAMVYELYEVDYEAIDIDPGPQNLVWNLITNASWLEINSITGLLEGTAALSNLGWYNVNVSVDDGEGGQDWHEFILDVIKENLPPIITTEDVLSATVNELYKVDYNATDVDTPLDKLTWSLKTNASWLNIDNNTGVLSGTPALEKLGKYWVNVTVTDEVGAFDFHNFTLTVYLTPNHPPEIITEDILNATVNITYSVDYEATDDRTPIDRLRWSLETNASWLSIDLDTGVLSGTPKLKDVGTYWVKVSVFDGEGGWDHHEFTLRVYKIPIKENNAPELSDPILSPIEGDTETEFTFSVHYFDKDNDSPIFIKLVIDNISFYNMTLKNGENASDGIYEYKIKLSEGIHTYYFTASDGYKTVKTDNFTTPYIKKSRKISKEEFNWLWLILIIIFIIIVILITMFVIIHRKKKRKEEQERARLTEGLKPEEPSKEKLLEPEILPSQPEITVQPIQIQIERPEEPEPQQLPSTPTVESHIERSPEQPSVALQESQEMYPEQESQIQPPQSHIDQSEKLPQQLLQISIKPQEQKPQAQTHSTQIKQPEQLQIELQKQLEKNVEQLQEPSYSKLELELDKKDIKYMPSKPKLE